VELKVECSEIISVKYSSLKINMKSKEDKIKN